MLVCQDSLQTAVWKPNSAPTRFTTGRVVRAIDYTDVATISRDDITECFANTWPDGPEKMCDCAYELYEMGA
jgi:hypothetical protein